MRQVRPVRLDHVSVTTADLDRSIAFYRDVIGLPLVDRGDLDDDVIETLTARPGARARWAELALGGGQVLELVQYLEPAEDGVDQRTWRPGATHIGLSIDAIDDVLERLGEQGYRSSEVVTLDEPGWEGVRCVYATDPDGVTIELVDRPAERIVVLPEADSAAAGRRAAPTA